jgi:glycosyltransferase involved in cell wall biosynthesis
MSICFHRNNVPNSRILPPVRILRVIARMNVGGPAYHVSLLSGRLDPQRFRTLLAHGSVGRGESSFAWLAEREGCSVELVERLGPEIRPLSDLRALARLVRIVRRFRPHIVHTHTAKAGMLGRLAAATAVRPRPLIVHTYHGHVLEGYFGALKSRLYRDAERGLGRVSDRLLGVSQATVDDLVRLRVAPVERFRVLPIGLDLEHFIRADRADGEAFRARVGADPDDLLLAYVGRLVPIKRVDVLLRALQPLRASGTPVRLAVIGDGESRAELERLAGDLGVEDAVSFVGFMQDVTEVAAAADIAVLSSDNEGTPVSLIEAAAAAVPAVATAVGGVPDVVLDERTGLLVAAGDHKALAAAIRRLGGDPALRERMGAAARAHVRERYSSERLVRDVEALYEELLTSRAASRIC